MRRPRRTRLDWGDPRAADAATLAGLMLVAWIVAEVAPTRLDGLTAGGRSDQAIPACPSLGTALVRGAWPTCAPDGICIHEWDVPSCDG